MTHDSTNKEDSNAIDFSVREITYDPDTNTYSVPSETMTAIRDGYRALDILAEDFLDSPYVSMMDAKTVEQFKNLTQTRNPVAREVIVAVALAAKG